MGTTALICALFDLFLSTLQTLVTLTLFLHQLSSIRLLYCPDKNGSQCQIYFFPSLFCSFLHSWSCCNPAGSQMAQIAQRERERGILNGSHSVMGLKMLKIVALAS